jgi:hypothetical protein
MKRAREILGNREQVEGEGAAEGSGMVRKTKKITRANGPSVERLGNINVQTFPVRPGCGCG